MNPSETDESQQGGQPNKKPQIGRREIGAFLLLLAINWTLVLAVLRRLRAAARRRSRTRRPSSRRCRPATSRRSPRRTPRSRGRSSTRSATRRATRTRRPTTEFSTRVPDFADTKALDTLLQEKGVVVTAKAPPGTPWWQTLLAGFLPTLLFFGLWYWIMRRSGSGSMFSFGSSKAKKYEPTTERVTFADVAGIDEAKEELAEVVDFLRDPDKYRKLGAHIPRGVLLTGAPARARRCSRARSQARPASRSSRCRRRSSSR